MKHNLRQLIKEVLINHKPDCGCGCNGKCAKAPKLNESLEVVITENMKYHINNKKPLSENTFRYSSKAFLDLWAEARYLYSRNAINISGLDKEIITESDLGEYGLFEGKKVPLDMPMVEEEQVPWTEKVIKYANEHPGVGPVKDLDKTQVMSILYKLDLPTTLANLVLKDIKNLNESKDEKHPPLNKPHRGGSKKFYVYVRDPKTKNIKKVSFGAAGGGQNLSVKIRDPKARKAFAKRQHCADKHDKTKPGYWACHIGRYWKSLGGGSNFSGYW